MNPELNIEEVIRCFPEQVVGSHGKPVYNLASPFEVALRENQLRLARAELDLGPAIPTQYLIYALGEPPSRAQTKIGGIPYRPRDLAWPHDDEGRPKEFVCQVNFSDASPLLTTLPDEVMLLFASHEGLDSEPFTLEWHPRGLTKLMEREDLPRFDFAFPLVREVVHCHLYKTHDFPEATTRLKTTQFEKWVTLGSPCGSKIAGFCEATPPDAQHVFTLESVRLYTRDPYLFVNQRNWKPTAQHQIFDILTIGDLGRIHIFQYASGRITATDVSH